MKKNGLIFVFAICCSLTNCSQQQGTSTDQKSVGKEKLLAHVDKGFIDKSGTLVITLFGNFHGKFSNGLARVLMTVKASNVESDKWGYIDATGKFVIQTHCRCV